MVVEKKSVNLRNLWIVFLSIHPPATRLLAARAVLVTHFSP